MILLDFIHGNVMLTFFLYSVQVKNDFSKPCVTDDTHYTFYLRNEAENPSQSD